MIRRPVTNNPKKGPIKCLMCSRDATTEVIMEMEEVIVVQKYCDWCLRIQ